MAHEAKAYPLEGKLEGFTDNQIQQHGDILYKGYINKLNEVEEKLGSADRSKANQIYSEFRGLKADETFALNGVVLHEIYFENMGGKGTKPGAETAKLIDRDFGGFDKWLEDFKATGMAVRGWVVFAYSLYDGKLHNYGLDSHNNGVPFFCLPLLIMDVYEHAYTIDYGVKRPPYIEAFVKNIDWNVVEKRVKAYTKVSA